MHQIAAKHTETDRTDRNEFCGDKSLPINLLSETFTRWTGQNLERHLRGRKTSTLKKSDYQHVCLVFHNRMLISALLYTSCLVRLGNSSHEYVQLCGQFKTKRIILATQDFQS